MFDVGALQQDVQAGRDGRVLVQEVQAGVHELVVVEQQPVNEALHDSRRDSAQRDDLGRVHHSDAANGSERSENGAAVRRFQLREQRLVEGILGIECQVWGDLLRDVESRVLQLDDNLERRKVEQNAEKIFDGRIVGKEVGVVG